MRIPSRRLLPILLVISLGLNVSQFLRTREAPESVVPSRTAARAAKARVAADVPPERNEEEEPEVEDDEPVMVRKVPPASSIPPEQQTEDELIYGKWRTGSDLLVPDKTISQSQLVDKARQPVSQAEKFSLRARLLLPGDRALDFGGGEVKAGQSIKMERLREFPFPTGVALAGVPEGAPDSVKPTTPADFETRKSGVTIDLDITPAPGVLMLGGELVQRRFEGFGRMPGEVFAPIVNNEGVLLTDNKMLQPQFTAVESPFLAAASAGVPIRVPVRMAFGETILELTCSPVE
jgi:hypothetical protein